ncbi:MAG: helix-hairpin-helix domain-containing protein [Acidimicrobiales bacterium]
MPGVGPATASAIIEYRNRRGRFSSVEELVEVRGIGEAKLAALRPRVRV